MRTNKKTLRKVSPACAQWENDQKNLWQKNKLV